MVGLNRFGPRCNPKKKQNFNEITNIPTNNRRYAIRNLVRAARVACATYDIAFDWKKARDFCTQNSYEMVKISNGKEQILMQKYLTLIDPDHEKAFWLGLTDVETEGTYLSMGRWQ